MILEQNPRASSASSAIETEPKITLVPKTQERIGFYLWGGPGTIRMIHVKYFNPRIDEKSIMGCYEYDYLVRAQALFGITDCWVSYSWGFSDETEKEDRKFILDRLDNFRRLGIRTHAYIQGPNLVYNDFKDKDWWARDEKGRMITYYRGRVLCSIHDESYVQYVEDKIRGLYNAGFDGIYIDNIQHGQLGAPTLPGDLPFVFCGDASPQGRAAFRADSGLEIPDDFEKDPALTEAYLNFRVKANTGYIKHMADVSHEGGMEFGTNFYDPKFDPKFIYGINLKTTAEVQDYVLFENHSLPRTDGKRHNGYIEALADAYYPDKRVFIVSYDQGVGMAPQFTQEQLDNMFSEANGANFSICLKGGEFTTKGVWHSLYLDDLTPPLKDKVLPREAEIHKDDLVMALLKIHLLRIIMKRYYNPIIRIVFEWRIFRFVIKIVYDAVLK